MKPNEMTLAILLRHAHEKGKNGVEWVDYVPPKKQIETLDPYKLLFLWTTFHQRMSQHMLKACGCDDKHLPQPLASEGK